MISEKLTRQFKNKKNHFKILPFKIIKLGQNHFCFSILKVEITYRTYTLYDFMTFTFSCVTLYCILHTYNENTFFMYIRHIEYLYKYIFIKVQNVF